MPLSAPQRTALGVFAALGVGVAVAGSTRRRRHRAQSTGRDDPPPPAPTGKWSDADAPRRIRAIAQPLADAAGWSSLPDLLVAIAWTESRGKPTVQNGTSANAARGWFGLRPVSARVEDLGLPSSALKREREAVALAAWYLHRLRPYAAPGQVIDNLALRRGMALPRLVSDVHETALVEGWKPGERSKLTRANFSEGLAAAGVPQSFMYEQPFGPGYAWPGIEAALNLVGA